MSENRRNNLKKRKKQEIYDDQNLEILHPLPPAATAAAFVDVVAVVGGGAEAAPLPPGVAVALFFPSIAALPLGIGSTNFPSFAPKPLNDSETTTFDAFSKIAVDATFDADADVDAEFDDAEDAGPATRQFAAFATSSCIHRRTR